MPCWQSHTIVEEMNIFKRISEIGLVPSDQYQEKRGIILSNSIALVLTLALCLLFSLRALVTNSVTVTNFMNTFVVGCLVLSSPIVLNSLSFTLVSRMVVCLVPMAFVWYAHIVNMKAITIVETSMYDSLRIYLLALSPFPYILFNKSQPWSLIFTILPSFLSFLFFEQLLEIAGVGHATKGTGGIDYPMMYIRGLLAYGIVSAICFTFQSIITKNDELNQKMMMELKAQTEEIESQNDALTQSQDRLNELYQNLEVLVDKKTEAVQMQHEKIIKYTFANSHVVRASVARILGLVQLSRMEPSEQYPVLLEKIAQETHELDEITKTITKDLEMMD